MSADGRTLVLGGARSGKSGYAQALLAAQERVRYVATGYPPGDGDPEWAERVRRHAAQRPPTWQTIETDDLPPVLAQPGPPLLIDCFSVWLARLMDKHDCWRAQRTPAGLAGEIAAAVEAWRACPVTAVAVSNETGMGVVPDTWSGRAFRDQLGLLNQQLAAASDHVWLLVAGLPVRVR
ncbi:MAG TPA: bifunctional adenosylcobinamide kinase/adenosylcobinamide-phosphate guanylyltransferase [Streptosporangiaceae bacterium]